jgi:hypothetical protein
MLLKNLSQTKVTHIMKTSCSSSENFHDSILNRYAQLPSTTSTVSQCICTLKSSHTAILIIDLGEIMTNTAQKIINVFTNKKKLHINNAGLQTILKLLSNHSVDRHIFILVL